MTFIRSVSVVGALVGALACGSSGSGSGTSTEPTTPGTDEAGADASSPTHDDASAQPDGSAPSPTTSTCPSTTLLDVPADRSVKGPWPVGAKSTTVNGLIVEVWYPAALGSDAGKMPIRYDIRTDLPADQAAKISDADNPYQPCDCVRDLPLDVAHGPYPLVVFIHGTAGFKTQNLDNLVHWASRGFVVMAADHPGLSIASFVGGGGTQNLPGDVQAEIAAMKAASGDLAVFAGHVDATRIGLVGHSAGGNGVAGMGDVPGAKVIIPISANAATTGASVESTLYVGGTADQVVSYSSQSDAYTKTAARSHKRLVGITGSGHTGVTSLCGIRNAAGNSIVDVAKSSGVLSGALGLFANTLFDCASNTSPQAAVIPIVNAATSAVLEETLHCDTSGAAAIDGIQGKFPLVQEYKHEP